MTLLPLSGSGPVFLDTITQRLKRAARYTRHRMSDNTRDTQNSFMTRLAAVRARIAAAERQNGRAPGSVALLAISKQHPVEDIAAAPAEALVRARAGAVRPRLRLRGLMCLPPESGDFATQRRYFHVLRDLFDDLRRHGLDVDTLSMGMSGDLEAAIAEGATLVRVGSALFGERPRKR